jgi:hypothetical protein
MGLAASTGAGFIQALDVMVAIDQLAGDSR